MARYIDANEFKRKMEQYLPEERELALKVLKKVPTADVVLKKDMNELTKEISDRIIQALEANYEIIPKMSVVRCKDCKFARSVSVPFDMNMRIICVKIGLPRGDGEFCSWGERRSE